jgi:hypothetical protein
MRECRDGIWRKAPCPLGGPGDRIVGKETWRVGAWREYYDGEAKFAFDYQASPELIRTPWVFPPDEETGMPLRDAVLAELEKKKFALTGNVYRWEPGKGPLSWRSPATMPAWASRITLEVESVRVCRLNCIYESDAMLTGVEPELVPPDGGGSPHKEGLRTFWNRRYGRRYPWESNPFVWAVGVKRVE